MQNIYSRIIQIYVTLSSSINTLRPRQNFSSKNFELLFIEWNVSVSITISLNFVFKGLVNNIPALFR